MAVASKIVETGYRPRKHQSDLHRSFKRFNVLVCHRRFGKTVMVINEMIDRGLRCQLKSPQFAYVAPTYGAAKRIAWEYFKDYTKGIPGVTVNEAELRIDVHRPGRGDRIRFMLLGAENPGSLRGIYLDGVILDEYAEMNPEVWSQVIRPALSDRKGWGVFIGTPKGRNHFYNIYHDSLKLNNWFHAIYKASETGVIDDEELEDAKATMSEEEYLQEYECSWSAAMMGSYYAKELARLNEKGKLYSEVPYDPALPVETFWDLGIGDSTAVWFTQLYGTQIRVIDYEEYSGVGLPQIIKYIKEKEYVYGDYLNLPHDGAARDLSTGRTRQETIEGLGFKSIVHPRLAIDDGINAVRMILPRCIFDKENCNRGIEALLNYQRKWDSKNQTFQNKPMHNWASHGADAFRVLGVSVEDSDESGSFANKSLPAYADNDYDIFG